MVERTWGRVHVAPAGEVMAGAVGTWRITYVCGPQPVVAGGAVLVVFPRCGWSSPQLFPHGATEGEHFDPTRPGLVWAECRNAEVKLGLTLEPTEGGRAPDGQVVWLWPGNVVVAEVTDGELQDGDVLVVTYGSVVSGSPGAVSGCHAGVHAFRVYVDPDGKRRGPCGGFWPVGDGVRVRCLPLEPERLVVVVPSRAQAGEPLDVGVVPRDRYGNAALTDERQVSLAGDSWDVRVQPSAAVGGHMPARLQAAARVRGSTLVRIVARDPALGLEGMSNPVEVSVEPPKLRVFWGDLHVHTGLSDGTGTPAEAYAYAREVALVDFAAITDHDAMLTQEKWAQIRHAAAQASEDGRFVAFSAYEWSGSGGHRGVYYASDDQPMYSSREPAWDTSAKLHQALRERGALVIPHHPTHLRRAMRWEGHDPQLERLVEVYSAWGSSEQAGGLRSLTTGHAYHAPIPPKGTTVQEALARGCRVGMVCATASHVGQPGYSDWLGAYGRRRGLPGGLAAVLAPELTREAIWQALQARRCYGTTGARMIVDLQIDGQPVGSELRRKAGAELWLRAYVVGTAPIEALELVKNNETLYAVTSDTDRATLEERIVVPQSGCDWYYLRVLQADGEMAWAGPIWVEPQ